MRAYRLLAQRDRNRLHAWTRDIAGAWARHWLADGADVDVSQVTAEVRPEAWSDGLLVRDDDSRWCAATAEPAHLRELAAALVGDGARRGESLDGELVEQLCHRALSALCSRFLEMDQDDADVVATRGTAPDAAFAPGAGSAVADIEVGAGVIRVLLAPDVAARHLADAPAAREGRGELHAPSSALERQRVRAVGVMSDTELELGALASLEVGDVIVLDHPLERPVQLRFIGADVRCEGFLCARGTQNALLLSQDATD